MKRTAAIFDLDRTLIRSSSAQVFNRHLTDVGLDVTDIPLADAFFKFYETFGETWVMMQPAKLGARTGKGWAVADVARAMEGAAAELEELLVPFAKPTFEKHRNRGDLLVMATTSPEPWVRPFAERLGFDAVIATRWKVDGAYYAGVTEGPFVWGRQKRDSVIEWATHNNVDLAQSYGYSDSYYDAPLLGTVGRPVAVNPDARLQALAAVNRWEVRHLDKSRGIFKVLGRELQDWTRPFSRPELVPFANFDIDGIDNVPADGPAILVFNHRSYFDPTAMALVAAQSGRSIRSLGKKEVFDVPIVGKILKGVGGIRVERGTGSDEPLRAAEAALAGGEVMMLAPQGTIPRGPAFFDPELKGRWGAARLAAASKAPVIPVGLWGTEAVWPRSSRLPKVPLPPLFTRPDVRIRVGPPIDLNYRSEAKDTERIMEALVEQLPPEARIRITPTAEQLLATFPPGYDGDPTAETDRRPGTDT